MRYAAAAIAVLLAPHAGYANSDGVDLVADCSASFARDKATYDPVLPRALQPYPTPAEASALQYRDRQSVIIADEIRAETSD